MCLRPREYLFKNRPRAQDLRVPYPILREVVSQIPSVEERRATVSVGPPGSSAISVNPRLGDDAQKVSLKRAIIRLLRHVLSDLRGLR